MNGPTPKKENKRAPTDATPVIDQQELHEMEEILKIKAAALKKEELDIQVAFSVLSHVTRELWCDWSILSRDMKSVF